MTAAPEGGAAYTSRHGGHPLEVLELMAQGHSNPAIAAQLVVMERPIAEHASTIPAKLGLEVSDDDNRRVLAVLGYVGQGRWERVAPRGTPTPPGH